MLRISGGIPNRCVTEVYGEPNTGKSTFVLYLAASLAAKNTSVILISTVKSLSELRYVKILESNGLNPQKLKKYTGFKDLKSLGDVIKYLRTEVANDITRYGAKMVCIDCISGLLDVDFINEENKIEYIERSKYISLFKKELNILSSSYDIAVVLTNNVDYCGRPQLNKQWGHGVNTRLKLSKSKNKSSFLEIEFSKSMDIRDVPIEYQLCDKGFKFDSFDN